jgi:hypothetical protein
MDAAEIKAYLDQFTGDDRRRAARHLIETNPAVAALFDGEPRRSPRGCRAGIRAMQPGYTGDNRNMAQASRGNGSTLQGWRYSDRGRIYPDTQELGILDFKAPGSVGRFLPDPPSDDEYTAWVCPGLLA